MCNLNKKSDLDKFVGYKLVAKHKETGKYYSLAMGFEYVEGELIPVPETQTRIAEVFNENILTGSSFVEEMVGRTAVYDSLSPTEMELPIFSHLTFDQYETRIMKVEISEDLMTGSYAISRVTAGRRIKFLEDVTNV
jgi:hypothetical protein